MNPTGGQIRSDNWGLGHFGAPRKRDDGFRYLHNGVDLICTPGQVVTSPLTGIIERRSMPYSNDPRFDGLILAGKRLTIRMFYVEWNNARVGENVKEGDPIGVAQDLRIKYPGITPHVHLEVIKCDPMIFI